MAQQPEWDYLAPFFDNQVDVNAEIPRVRYCQSFWNFGWPIEYDGTRYNNSDEDPIGQLENARDGIVEPMADWV